MTGTKSDASVKNDQCKLNLAHIYIYFAQSALQRGTSMGAHALFLVFNQ